MTVTKSGVHITQIGPVFVAVSDPDRALEFYIDKLGFEKRADFTYGEGSRWIEVAPPGSKIQIALVPPREGRSACNGDTKCAFSSENIVADHATLHARGVDTDTISRKGELRAAIFGGGTAPHDAPPMFFFRDPDGNRFLMVDASGPP